MFDLEKIFTEMSGVQLVIVGALGLMALASIAVFVERVWIYARTRRKSARFGATAARYLTEHKYNEFQSVAEREKGNPLAALLAAGIRRYRQAMTQPSPDVGPVELTRRELERQADGQAALLRRGLNVLASVGSTAPFVGLLGTVVGIISAFQGIGQAGTDLSVLSVAIGEALVVTAFGLAVAIPSVLMFNFLAARADSLELAIDQSRGQFIDHLEAHHSFAPSDQVGEARASAA